MSSRYSRCVRRCRHRPDARMGFAGSSIRRRTRRPWRPTSSERRQEAKAFKQRYQGKLPGIDGAALGGGHKVLRGAAGRAGPDHELCRACPCRQRRCDPEIGRFYQTMQERINEISTDLLFFTSRSTARGCRAREPSWPTRRWRITGRGCATSALSARTSSPTTWRSCCTKSRSPAAPPGCGCSTRRSPICAFRSTARS